MTSRESSNILQSPADSFGLFFNLHCSVYDTNTSYAVYYFFESTVIDNVNTLKINGKLKHQFTVYFENSPQVTFLYSHNCEIDYLQSYGDYGLM